MSILLLPQEVYNAIFKEMVGGGTSYKVPLDFYHDYWLEDSQYARLKEALPVTCVCRALYVAFYEFVYCNHAFILRCQPQTTHWTSKLRSPQERFLRYHGSKIHHVCIDVYVLSYSALTMAATPKISDDLQNAINASQIRRRYVFGGHHPIKFYRDANIVVLVANMAYAFQYPAFLMLVELFCNILWVT